MTLIVIRFEIEELILKVKFIKSIDNLGGKVMNITVISVGKLKERYLKQAIDEYSKRLTRYCKIDIIELPDEKTPDNASEKEELQIKYKEGQLILSKIKDNMFVVAMDLNAKQMTSEEFSKLDVYKRQQ